MAGVLSWIVAGSVVVAATRLVKRGRRALLPEAVAGSAAAVGAGLVATAMDFGGIAVLDVRAIAFAALAAAAGVAAIRLIPRNAS